MWPRNTREARIAICASLIVAAASSHAQEPTARISGRLTTSDGRMLLSGAVMMAAVDTRAEAVPPDEVRILPDGQFSFGRVAPGKYQIRARGQTQSNGPALFATFTLDVGARDISNIDMTLKPGAVLTGQVVAEAPRRTKARIPFGALAVRAPLADGSDFGDALTGHVQRDGSFAIRGLAIGTHHVILEGLPGDWTIKSVLLRGRDVTDQAFDVESDQAMRDALVTLTQRFSEVAGRVLDSSQAPAGDVPVLVYSMSPQFWIPGGRRIRLLRTDADGRFVLKGLPAGGYLAVALAARDATTAPNAQELERLRSVATPVTLAADDTHATVDLQIARAPAAPVR